MKTASSPEGSTNYVLWHEYKIRAPGKPDKIGWLNRTSRKGGITLEMVESLTGDLTANGIKWEIRDVDGKVLQKG